MLAQKQGEAEKPNYPVHFEDFVVKRSILYDVTSSTNHLQLTRNRFGSGLPQNRALPNVYLPDSLWVSSLIYAYNRRHLSAGFY